MTGQDLMEKFRRYPIPTISVVIVLLCLVAYYFRIDLISDLDARQSEVLDQRNQVDLNLVAGGNLAEHMNEMRTRFAALEERVVQPYDLASNMNYFYQLESNSGVGLGELKQNASSDKPVPKNKLGGVGYTVSMTGSFAQIVGAFNELENGQRFYRLRHFNLERGREVNGSVIQLSLNLELLGWQQ
jgi:Tfp pilus assembly protein PilO